MIEHGIAEGLPRIAEMLLNGAMIFERSAHLGAKPFDRCEERTGYANGLKDRTFQSSLGSLSLRVPQTRGCENPKSPQCLRAAPGSIERSRLPWPRCIFKASQPGASPLRTSLAAQRGLDRDG